jgi:hypothetical protein
MRRTNLFLWPSDQRLDILTIFYRSMSNDQFHSYYVDSIYPSELEIKDTTESSTSTPYLDVLLNMDAFGKLTTEFMTNGMISILSLSTSHIHVATSYYHLHMAYIYISQLILHARACSTYDQVFSRGRPLTDKLMLQESVQDSLM